MKTVTQWRALQGIRFSLLHSLLDSPLGHEYMTLRHGYDGYRIEEGTRLVIEGFPRSANTYAWYAARLALGPEFRVRGHTHAADTVVKAVKQKIPTLVLIRDPDGAVSSLVQLAEGVSLERAFKAYSGFYRKVLPVLSEAVLVTFDEVVGDFPKAMESFLRQFDLDWPSYQGGADNEAVVRNQIDEASRRRQGGTVREVGVARPSPHRRKSDEMLAVLTPSEARARDDAWAVYRDCVESFAAPRG